MSSSHFEPALRFRSRLHRETESTPVSVLVWGGFGDRLVAPVAVLAYLHLGGALFGWMWDGGSVIVLIMLAVGGLLMLLTLVR